MPEFYGQDILLSRYWEAHITRPVNWDCYANVAGSIDDSQGTVSRILFLLFLPELSPPPPIPQLSALPHSFGTSDSAGEITGRIIRS